MDKGYHPPWVLEHNKKKSTKENPPEVSLSSCGLENSPPAFLDDRVISGRNDAHSLSGIQALFRIKFKEGPYDLIGRFYLVR
jgi:hypothetical protein